MTPTRKKRLALVAVVLLGVSTATVVAISALQTNLLFFVSPTDVHAQILPADRQFRLGGLVAEESVVRDPHSLAVTFTVTDGLHDVLVTFNGILPDLFREGQGVIAHGKMGGDGMFHAHEVLARHDETYMSPEVARALEKAGQAHQVSMPTTYQDGSQ
jgi:cytochrome c-type biogenesis protein CcmE